MNRLLMVILITLFFLEPSIAQIPSEAFTLTNSLPGLWNKGQTEEAVEMSLELFRVYPAFFIDRIHNTLALQIKEDPEPYGYKYLEQLYQKKNPDINKIIQPIYLWSKVLSTRNKINTGEILKELNIILRSETNYESRSERYCLLTLLELDKENVISKRNVESILDKIISNLESYPYIVEISEQRHDALVRGWHRYLLAYSYHYLYTTRTKSEEYLIKASDYSPDLTDRKYRQSYFYDALVLTGNGSEIGFQHVLKEYLLNHNRDKEALTLLSEITFANPSDENLADLRKLFERPDNSENFSHYWKSYISAMGKPLPHVIIKSDTVEFDHSKLGNKWTLIDIWGTWCVPCLEELPDLQTYYTENIRKKNTNLRIVTFSFGSQKLKEFMTDNKYSFPVIEIDKQTTELFDISGYPTKILVTPNGTYITIPFGTDWRVYVRNYTLAEN